MTAKVYRPNFGEWAGDSIREPDTSVKPAPIDEDRLIEVEMLEFRAAEIAANTLSPSLQKLLEECRPPQSH